MTTDKGREANKPKRSIRELERLVHQPRQQQHHRHAQKYQREIDQLRSARKVNRAQGCDGQGRRD